MTVKELQQKHDAVVAEMNKLVDAADTETETRAFEAYIRSYGQMEMRTDDGNMTIGENGAVVPATVANKIIEKVLEICPIYADADRYNVKGTLTIPYYDSDNHQIVCGYADDFDPASATEGAFGAITLTGFLGEALTNVGKRLINNSQFDIVSYVINKVAEAVAKFIEKELIIGTPATTSGGTTVPAKIEGLSSLAAGQIIESAANTAITADELIQVQEQVPDAYQENAYWIMNRKTRTAIRQLKESGTGAYLLNKDANSRWFASYPRGILFLACAEHLTICQMLLAFLLLYVSYMFK